MDYTTKAFTLLLFLMCILYREVLCRTETLSVEARDCKPYKVRHVNGGKQYVITWKGGEIPSLCSFGFVGRDDITSKFKVCVEATTYNVTDCRVKMEYQKGINIDLYSTYSCYDKVEKFCGDSDDYVEIEFDTGFLIRPKNNDRITLKVTSDMTFNGPVVIGCSVAGAILCVVLISTSVALIIRRNQRSHTAGKMFQPLPPNYSAPPNANAWYSQRGYFNQVTDKGQEQLPAASHFPPPS